MQDCISCTPWLAVANVWWSNCVLPYLGAFLMRLARGVSDTGRVHLCECIPLGCVCVAPVVVNSVLADVLVVLGSSRRRWWKSLVWWWTMVTHRVWKPQCMTCTAGMICICTHSTCNTTTKFYFLFMWSRLHFGWDQNVKVKRKTDPFAGLKECGEKTVSVFMSWQVSSAQSCTYCEMSVVHLCKCGRIRANSTAIVTNSDGKPWKNNFGVRPANLSLFQQGLQCLQCAMFGHQHTIWEKKFCRARNG